ncbi:hypothetical protein [Marinobacter sp.]|uniref:hypothetical protein n=1 Tax=Marinobacter sp. TaxID=50741 RepID=UPI0025C666CD|nr:hypothetical protein [Marinobacter sp.]
MSRKILLALIVLVLIGVGLYHTYKPLPPGISHSGEPHPLSDEVLLTDATYHHSDGPETHKQEIFDEILRLIGQAESFILVDMLLFNSSSRHSNTAVSFTGPAVFDVLKSEQAVLNMSDQPSAALNNLISGAKSPAPADPQAVGQIAVKQSPPF